MTTSHRRTHGPLATVLLLATAACARTGAVDLAVEQVDVTPRAAILPVGTTVLLEAFALQNDGTPFGGTITWASADESVATVDRRGVVTTLAPGLALVRATAGKVSGEARVRVVDAALAALAIEPALTELARGDERGFVAIGTLTDGTELDLTADLSWSSDDRSVAIASDGGLVTAMNEGETAVRASAWVAGLP
jgi:trimeric autotransporter adhesin